MTVHKTTLDLIFPLEKGITKSFPIDVNTTVNDLHKFLNNGKPGLYEIFVDGKGTVSLNDGLLHETGMKTIREFLQTNLQTPVFWRGSAKSNRKGGPRKIGGLYRLSQGGGKFIDVSNEEARVTRQFVSAPPWRIVIPGMCLESICAKPGCEARGNPVICKVGQGLYNPITVDGHCPMCSSKVKGNKLYFSQCFYRIRALKTGRFEETRITWTEVGHEYQTWDDKKAGVVDWDFMEVEARPLDGCMPVPNNPKIQRAPVAEECAMCFNEIRSQLATQSIRMLSCCHSFHSSCVQKWITQSGDHNVPACCPICREKIE